MIPASMFAYPKQDIISGIVVFLVALPLCMGIAVASNVPPVSGLVAGIIGGLIVPWISRSHVAITGPAAGLATVVVAEIEALGTVNLFFTATIVAGLIQFVLGIMRYGRYSALVPSAVVKGMLAAIGILIVWKQIPVALGVSGGLSDIPGNIQIGAALLAVVSIVILHFWRFTPLGRFAILSPHLMVVLIGSVAAAAFAGFPVLALERWQFVNVPLGGIESLAAALPRPDLSGFSMPAVWISGVVIAVVASIESLLSLQAVERLDPLNRTSPPDRDLVAQGAANTVCGFLGALPITAVIVRSSTNIAAGGRERFSNLVHAILLLGAVVFAGALLNRIPLPCLAAILIYVGLILCKPALFAAQAKLGIAQFFPFAITIAAVLIVDLMTGVIIGIVVGICFVIFQNVRGAVVRSVESDGTVVIRFIRDGTFLSKPTLVSMLSSLPSGSRVIIDGTGEYIDYDVYEVIESFQREAENRDIVVGLRGIDQSTGS